MRLINADVLKDRIREVYTVADDEESSMEQIVDEQPTVDAVELVRCKDCIHSDIIDHYWVECEHLSCCGDRDNPGCPFGERK